MANRAVVRGSHHFTQDVERFGPDHRRYVINSIEHQTKNVVVRH